MSIVQVNPCIVSERWAEVIEWAARVLDVPVACDSEGWGRLHAATDGVLVLDPKRVSLGSNKDTLALDLHVHSVPAVLERAKAAGAKVLQAPTQDPDGTARAAIETPQNVVLWLRDEKKKAKAGKGTINNGPMHFTVNRRLAAPPARVFEAITNKADLESFFVNKVEGNFTKEEKIEWTFEGYGAFPLHRLDLKANEFLSFHWSTHEGYDTRVQMALRPKDGGTELAITESGWNNDPRGVKNAFDNCEGWTTFLANLSLYLDHGISPMKK